MVFTFLGTGTSSGIPVIGCSCPVCSSKNVKNKRTRCSVWLKSESTSVLIDTATDFYFQALRENMRDLDAIFFTHAHADHLHGLDDVRPITWNHSIPVFGNKPTIAEIRLRFDYVFKRTQKGGGKPRIELNVIQRDPITIGDITLLPVPIIHGNLPILGFRINDTAYLTDCSGIPDKSLPLLKNLDNLIVGALRYTSHPTHFSVSDAVDIARRLRSKRTYLTHLSHDLEHEKLSSELPPTIQPAYDGLRLAV